MGERPNEYLFYLYRMNIRKATTSDFPQVLELIKQLAEFEKATHKVTNTVEQMIEEQDSFFGFVAENEQNEIVGIALCFEAYSTWVGKYLFLEDLIVNEKYRGQGIGGNLIKEVFRTAKKAGYKRVRWQVLNWNSKAIEFYEKIGADIDKEWYNCDFDEDKINFFPD